MSSAACTRTPLDRWAELRALPAHSHRGGTPMNLVRPALALFLIAPLLPLTAQAAATGDPPYERVLNGTFDAGTKSPWWSSGSTPTAVTDGRLCAQVPAGT